MVATADIFWIRITALKTKYYLFLCRVFNLLFSVLFYSSSPFAVLRIRIRDPVLFDPWIRDPDLGMGMEKIQSQDLGSGINIPDLIFESLVGINLVNSRSGNRNGKNRIQDLG
jgi:hypothetical protein